MTRCIFIEWEIIILMLMNYNVSVNRCLLEMKCYKFPVFVNLRKKFRKKERLMKSQGEVIPRGIMKHVMRHKHASLTRAR